MDRVCELVADAVPIRKIAAEFGTDHGTLLRFIREDAERTAAYEAAKSASAETLIEKANDLIENADPQTTPEVSWAKEKVGYYRWLAGLRSEDYSEKKQSLNVNVDLGLHHLAALMQGGSMDKLGLGHAAEPEPIEAEYTVEPEKKLAAPKPKGKEKTKRLGDLPGRKG